ncbi:uncharacterized protein LOC110739615, partial [Chenopodium quinoa]|uniref:uncharacterized protein LOC110739615 n=1 Tax=Chenopodium quinoa TaxID=63459 RepID=UPI000B77473B
WSSKSFPTIYAPIFGNPLRLAISIQALYQNKYTAISGVKRYLRTTCTRVFSDILSSKLQSDYSIQFIPYQMIRIPGSPDPIFGFIYLKIWPQNHVFSTNYDIFSWIHALGYIEDEEDRSLYLTFSKGEIVSEDEVRSLFTLEFGDCVQRVHMPEIRHSQQNLFARVSPKYVETTDIILKGKSLIKFKIRGGKHVWAKKYRYQNSKK